MKVDVISFVIIVIVGCAVIWVLTGCAQAAASTPEPVAAVAAGPKTHCSALGELTAVGGTRLERPTDYHRLWRCTASEAADGWMMDAAAIASPRRLAVQWLVLECQRPVDLVRGCAVKFQPDPAAPGATRYYPAGTRIDAACLVAGGCYHVYAIWDPGVWMGTSVTGAWGLARRFAVEPSRENPAGVLGEWEEVGYHPEPGQ